MNTVVEEVETAATEPPSRHALHCMEIWGGNRATRNAVSVTGIDAYVFSQPYAEQSAGGDIHYVSMCGGGKIARFAVADVSGHGDAVSGLAAKLRALVRKHINTVDQTRFVRSLNSEFSRLADTGTFATAILATYFAPTDHLVVVNAGHPAPLWYRARYRTWGRLEATQPETVGRISNLPLGIIDPTEYCQFAVPLSPEDRVLIYTDSLMEAVSPSGEQLGEEGLLRLVEALPLEAPAAFCDRLLGAVKAFRGGGPAEDDVTLLLLQHNANDPARQSLAEWTRVVGRMLGLMSV